MALGASVQKRSTPHCGSLKLVAVLSVLAGSGLTALPVQAAARAEQGAASVSGQSVTAVAAKDVETTSSIRSNSSDDARCDVARKRLFVEGEGWIVRRVTTCY